MLRPEFATLALPQAPAGERIAAPQGGRGGAPFAGFFNEVREDVLAFIEQGSGSAMGGLSPEGSLHRARLQPASPAAVAAAALEPAALEASGLDAMLPPGDPKRQFLADIAPWAEEAGQRLGVSPRLVAAHAALESGWGQRPLRGPDGETTHNLFGIKATGGWGGEAADALTTEFIGGTPVRKTERFRSYDSAAGAFRDYASLLLGNPRYRAALNVGDDAQAFASGLARGGYATDPGYADKLVRIAARLQSAE